MSAKPETLTTTKVEPYLCFDGRCAEALEFYKTALDAQVEMVMRFKDAPEQCGGDNGPTTILADKVMHSSMRIGDSVVMATDGCGDTAYSGKPSFTGTSLSLAVPTEALADRYFGALAAGGNIVMPMDKTFFAKKFGVVADKFGVNWMVIVPAEM